MSLDDTAKQLLESETFDADELVGVLVARGHDEADVQAAIERAVERLRAEQMSPRKQRKLAAGRSAGRFLRLGVFTLVVGTGYVLFSGVGWLQLLVVVVIGGAFIAAGFRGLRHGRG